MKLYVYIVCKPLQDFVGKDLDRTPELTNLGDEAYLRKAAERMPDIGKKVEYLLNTGNLVSKSGLDLSQATGFTVRGAGFRV